MTTDTPAPPAGHRLPSPLLFMILMVPFGVANGYLTVTLGYQLTQQGMSTAVFAELYAISLIPHTWRYLWAPVVDTTWTRKRWYVFGTAVCGGGIWVTGVLAGRPHPAFFTLAALQLGYNVGATLLAMAVESLLAATVPDDRRGRTSGWFQAGNLGGQGIGGGLALWLIQGAGWSSGASSGTLAALFVLCCLPLAALPDPKTLVAVGDELEAPTNLSLADNARAVARDLWQVVRSRTGALAIVICFLPIGSGAAQNLWSTIAGDWHASADTVALVNGAMGGVISAIGCVAGGWICDHIDRRTAYCLFGALLVLAAVAMALCPRTSPQFVAWTSVYAFVLGLCYASFSAVVFEAIGRTAAATKYSLLAALSNMPIQYMTLVDGWADDKGGTGALLYADAAGGVIGIVVFLIVAGATKRAKTAGLAQGDISVST